MINAFWQEVVLINFIPGCIIIFLVVFLLFNNAYEKELTKLFEPVLILLAALVIDDNLHYFAFLNNPDGFMHLVIVYLGFNIRIFIMISLARVAFRNSHRKYIKDGLYIPAFINLLVTSATFFTDSMYSLTEEGEIVIGPTGYLPHAILIVFSIFLYIFSVHIWRAHDRRSEAAVICMTLTLAILGTAFELIFSLKGILIGVIAMAVTFYYLCIHIDYFKFDTLTGSLNRTSFYADISKLKKKNNIGLIAIDLNDLKKINDEKGHIEGDMAIKTMAHVIGNAINNRSTLYRMGGDEFAIICKNMTDDEIKLMINNIREQMKETKYSFAMGYSLWNGREKFRDVYSRADKAMYVNKKEMKNTGGDMI